MNHTLLQSWEFFEMAKGGRVGRLTPLRNGCLHPPRIRLFGCQLSRSCASTAAPHDDPVCSGDFKLAWAVTVVSAVRVESDSSYPFLPFQRESIQVRPPFRLPSLLLPLR